MKNEIGDFLDYLTYERNVSTNTITAYRDDLESFVGFLCFADVRRMLRLKSAAASSKKAETVEK